MLTSVPHKYHEIEDDEELKAFVERRLKRQKVLMRRFYLLGTVLIVAGGVGIWWSYTNTNHWLFWVSLMGVCLGGWLNIRLQSIVSRANNLDDGSN